MPIAFLLPALRDTPMGRMIAGTLLTLGAVLTFGEVDGPSMEPTYETGDVVVVNRFPTLTGGLAPGSIVILDRPDNAYIKRVVGVGGDRVQVGPRGVKRNGEMAEEGYTHNAAVKSHDPKTVPPDWLYVVGDNRPISVDSRRWGPVKGEEVHGAIVD